MGCGGGRSVGASTETRKTKLRADPPSTLASMGWIAAMFRNQGLWAAIPKLYDVALYISLMAPIVFLSRKLTSDDAPSV